MYNLTRAAEFSSSTGGPHAQHFTLQQLVVPLDLVMYGVYLAWPINMEVGLSSSLTYWLYS